MAERRWSPAAWLPLLPDLIGVTLLALPTLAWPFGLDQAVFATVGRAINSGRFPYVDAWDLKPPGIDLLYAVALRLPGPLMMRVRLFDLLWTLATITVIYETARTLWSPRAGVWAALLYGAVYFTTQGYWYLAQPDGFTGLPLSTALLLHLRAGGRRAPLAWAVAGALIGVAVQLRFTALPMVPAYAAMLAWRTRRGWRPLAREWLWMAAGFVTVQLALAGYLWAGHALRAYIEATRFASGYAKLGWPFGPAHPTAVQFLGYVRSSLLFFGFANAALVLPAVAGAFAAFALRPDDRARGVAAMALVGFAGIAAQQKFFWYHWQLILPALALLAGWGYDALFQSLGQRFRPRTALVASGVLVLGLALATPNVTDFGYAQWDDLLHRNDTVMNRIRYDNQFGGYADGTYSYVADRQVAAYLRGHTSPGDTVYVFGNDPMLYLLSERESASRFIYSLPLMSSWAPPRWTDEFLGEIDRARPVYFIVQRNEGAARWITGQSEDTAAWAFKIQGLARRLERDYVQEVVIEDFTLYRRR
jgi:hypothetical protein